MPAGRRFLIAVIPLFLLLSCTREERREAGYLTLSTTSVSLPPAASTRNLIVSSNLEPELLTPLPSWLDVRLGGEGPDYLLVFQASENSDERSRSVLVTLGAGNLEETLVVTQAAVAQLSVASEKRLTVSAEAAEFRVSIDANCPYSVKLSDTWIAVKGAGSGSAAGKVRKLYRQPNLDFTVAENAGSKSRSAMLVFFSEDQTISDTVRVVQEAGASSWYADGDWECIQTASCSPAPSLCIMGDGFIREDLAMDGAYRRAMLQAAEYFFSIEPYSTYREFFDVYVVYAESAERGVGDKVKHKVVNNRFGTKYGRDTEIDGNVELCLQYAAYADGGSLSGPLTALVVLNDSKYAGTTYMYLNGNSVAFCPMIVGSPPNDFEGVIHHECGGHGFGFLADEYVYYDKRMPESDLKELRDWQAYGYQSNLDLSGSAAGCLWAYFIGHDKYPGAGMFEGGGLYRYGVWRSESNSCMNNNVPYFSVQSRQAIVRRIMSMRGREFSVEEFIEADTGSPVAPVSITLSYSPIPLGRPKLISNTYH